MPAVSRLLENVALRIDTWFALLRVVFSFLLNLQQILKGRESDPIPEDFKLYPLVRTDSNY